MRTKYHQITLKDTFSDCQDMFRDDSPSFFQLLDDTLDISEFIPADFYHVFYLILGRKRTYPLDGLIPLCPYPSENLFYPYRLSAHSFSFPLQGITGLLRLL